MIAVLAGAALAAPTVDLLLVPVTAHTASVSAQNEVLDVVGQAQTTRLVPDRSGLGYRGLSVELGTAGPGLEPHEYLVMAGVRVGNPRYERAHYTFAPTATELTLAVGMRFWFAPRSLPTFDGYGIGFTGGQLGLVAASPFTGLTMAPALTGGLGIGIGARKGRIRPRIEGRAELAARWDHLAGRVEEPVEALTWKWYPGSAAASLLIGVGFGPKAQPELVPAVE